MYGNSVYSNPSKHGLEIVGEFDWAEPDYSFDLCVIWKEKRGAYWIGNDSGCSCPSPFEEVMDKNELDGPYRKEDLRKRLDFLIEERIGSRHHYGRSKAELVREAREIVNRA